MAAERINVTKSFLPPFDEYETYLKKIWQTDHLTNQGPLLQELESSLRSYIGTPNFHFVSNGTIALQIALRALDITDGEIITTPFSYVATTSAILWERCTPVYVDIDPDSLCIDSSKIEAAITKNTKAIMPVHVFGMPCDIAAISQIAKKHNLKVIYDAAHAFGAKYNGNSLVNYGDIATCSFHATKLFHTIEGGGIIATDPAVSAKIELLKRFGHNGDEHLQLGINAKASEFQAAMGLCNLKYIDDIIATRRAKSALYDSLLGSTRHLDQQKFGHDFVPNYSYYPIILASESDALTMIERLAAKNIFARRYFYPSLNTLPYLTSRQSCPISEDIASRILCLPLYVDLDDATIKLICEIITT